MRLSLVALNDNAAQLVLFILNNRLSLAFKGANIGRD
jgi:hypothetical protein